MEKIYPEIKLIKQSQFNFLCWKNKIKTYTNSRQFVEANNYYVKYENRCLIPTILNKIKRKSLSVWIDEKSWDSRRVCSKVTSQKYYKK